MRPTLFIAAFGAALALPAAPSFAASAIQKECSAKYQAAKTSNALNGMTYNQYYKQCAADVRSGKTTPTAAPPAAAAPTPIPAAPAPKAAPPTTTATRAPVAPAAAGAAVFPTAVSPQYKDLSAGIARRKTCDDQYKLNKANNGNGGLKWIEKGGGYYSECNKRLKG